MAMPATGAFTGTPASISDNEPPHTLAIEVEPLDSKISETIRMVYGKLSSIGRTGNKRALSQITMADLAPARTAQEI